MPARIVEGMVELIDQTLSACPANQIVRGGFGLSKTESIMSRALSQVKLVQEVRLGNPQFFRLCLVIEVDAELPG
jgi:hypothetical protein